MNPTRIETSKLHMGVQLLGDTIRYAKEHGIRETLRRGTSFVREASLRWWHQVSGQASGGKYVFEEEWDILVVLDACRADALAEVADEYSFLDTPGTFESVGSYSLAWMEENFREEFSEEMSETAMITGNPFSETAFEAGNFKHLEEVWKHTWDEEVGTIPPRPITDRVISLLREHDPDRTIVHYMQPHEPFTTHPELQDGSSAEEWGDAVDKSVWKRVEEGDIAQDRAHEAYMDELRMILDEVALLLENVDAEKVVITADHGEAMGEYGIYGHPRGIAIDELRTVPWYETSSEDTETYEPTVSSNELEGDQVDRLRDLGYLE